MAKAKEKVLTVCRINKASLSMITDKRKYYYMDQREDEEGNKDIYYVLVDNTKGKKELTEFDSLTELEKFIKK